MSKMYTQELSGEDAREALKKGIDRVATPVIATIGAKGRNTVYREFGFSKVTNDGVSIARRINPQDEFERLGANLIKETAERTVMEAGDGTTTTITLSHALATDGIKEIDSGKSPMELRSELEDAKNIVIDAIKGMARKVSSREDILNVVRVSVEDEEMAQIVADAVEKAGEHGAVVVEEGSGYTIEKEEVRGYFWDRGFISPYMITNPDRNETILEDVPVIVTDRYMNLNRDLVQTVNQLMQKGEKSAFIIVDRMEGELLATVITNKVKGNFTLIAVQRPSTQDELEDIATIVGGTAVTKDKGIKNIEAIHIGRASRIIVGLNKTTIIVDDSPAIADRIKSLEEVIKTEEDDERKRMLITRLAKLTDGIVMLKVGAKTEAERKYKKDKLDDAVGAAKAALDEGIVDGGGIALVAAATVLEDNETVGAQLLYKALSKPYECILKNADLEVDGKFYNVKTGKEVEDMMKEGIIDPAKVVRCAVENAVSFAGTFLTIENVVADFIEEER